MQVIVDHPEDIALLVSHGSDTTSLSGFEFGRDTVTLTAAGQYRIQISPAGGTRQRSLTVHMSRRALSLPAVRWQAAEASAAEAKSTGKIPSILASLERWNELQDLSAIARTWLKLGDAELSLGDAGQAYDAYEHALETCRSIHDERCIAEAANNSGYSAQQLGDLSNSFSRLDEAAKDWEHLSLPLNQGKTLSNLGILYCGIGDFQRAIDTYDRAGSILKPLDALGYARVLNNLGRCYLSLARYDHAKLYFRKAMEAEAKLEGARGDWLRARLNLGRALMLQGRLQRARILIQEIVIEAEKQPDRSIQAFALNNLGQTLFRLGLADTGDRRRRWMDAAEAELKRSLDLHRIAGDKRWQATAEHYLGLISSQRGDLAAARAYLGQALDIRRACGLRDEAADSLFALAELEFAAGDSDQAQSLAQEAIGLLESIRSRVPGAALRASFYARRRNLLDLLVAIAMRPGNPNAPLDGLIAAELGRSRSLLDVVGERERSSPSPPELMERQAKIRREINFLSLMVTDESKPHAGAKQRLEALIAEDEQVEAHIRESIEDREPGVRPLHSLALLQQTVLSPDKALLEYQLGERNSYLWLVRDRTIEVFTLPSRSAIERQISAAIRLFINLQDRLDTPAMQREYLVAMHRLSATLLGNLPTSDLPPLLILVLDGDLHRVPFAALSLAAGGYLGLSHDLVRAPSAAFLQQSSRQQAIVSFPKSILALYDPVFSGADPRVPQQFRKSTGHRENALSRLPFDDELKTIRWLVPRSRRDVLNGLDANVPALQSMPLDQYAVLYLSTHAIINDEIPELSRIALSAVDRRGRPIDGFLFPYQLAGLPLHHSTVVLSACKTALGKTVLGEGLVGFSSSLFSAGASQLVLTISDVDARASSIFLSQTYRRLFAPHPESIEHAMTLTRRSFVRSQWSDPYYWASFVVLGVPSSRGVESKASPRVP